MSYEARLVGGPSDGTVMAVGDRVCWLITCNGGPVVSGWGCIGYSGGPFQEGLDQNDTLELLQCNAFIDGWQIGSGWDVWGQLHKYCDAYVDAVMKQHES